MSPTDSQSDDAPIDKASPGGGAVRRGKWSLQERAFTKLLACFSLDHEEAGRQFLIAYLKLTRFFEWHLCDAAESCADKTVDRAARRIDEGEHINNLMGYLYGIAEFVLKEWRKERDREPLSLEGDEQYPLAMPDVDEEREARLRCLDICLAQMHLDDRAILLGYYQEDKRAKIEFRKQMADRLGIGLNTLRIRVFRLRVKLEECIVKCLEASGVTPK